MYTSVHFYTYGVTDLTAVLGMRTFIHICTYCSCAEDVVHTLLLVEMTKPSAYIPTEYISIYLPWMCLFHIRMYHDVCMCVCVDICICTCTYLESVAHLDPGRIILLLRMYAQGRCGTNIHILMYCSTPCCAEYSIVLYPDFRHGSLVPFGHWCNEDTYTLLTYTRSLFVSGRKVPMYEECGAAVRVPVYSILWRNVHVHGYMCLVGSGEIHRAVCR